MANATGTAIFNFGAGSGTNIATVAVSDASISATSKVEVYLMGTDSTASHNTVEHQMLPLGGLSLTVLSITPTTEFTIQAMSSLRLTGTFQVRWVWVD